MGLAERRCAEQLRMVVPYGPYIYYVRMNLRSPILTMRPLLLLEKPCTLQSPGERRRMDLVCVLDVSGSMMDQNKSRVRRFRVCL